MKSIRNSNLHKYSFMGHSHTCLFMYLQLLLSWNSRAEELWQKLKGPRTMKYRLFENRIPRKKKTLQAKFVNYCYKPP